MTTYSICLTVSNKGVHAHALDLPGCFSRGRTRDEALSAMPAAIRQWIADRRRHGEEMSVPVEIALEIEEIEERASGPFDPGDSASLFEADKVPLEHTEIERYLKLAAHNRLDLLARVDHLRPGLLDWQPGADSFSIRRILRHVGNAEEWYYSRLAQPEDLPPEWENDAEMEIFDFLDMERSTMASAFRGLSETARREVVAPTHFTTNTVGPDGSPEPWTARKALRRMLEHEREHSEQIGQVLAHWRQQLLSHLAGARSYLLWQLRGLPEEVLSGPPVFDDHTARDLLAHVGYWDEFHGERLERVARGQTAAIESLEMHGGLEARNAERLAIHQAWTFPQALEYLLSRRQACLAALAGISDADLHRQIEFPWDWISSPGEWVSWRMLHDLAHAEDLKTWRKTIQIENQPASRQILSSILQAAFDDMDSLIDLIPQADHQTRTLTGTWTLADVIGHLADWETLGLEWSRRTLAGEPTAGADPYLDIEAANERMAAKRKGQSWERIWSDYRQARQQMLALLDRSSREDLLRPLTTPWGEQTQLQAFLLDWAWHDRDHAAALRMELSLPDTPEQLLPG